MSLNGGQDSTTNPNNAVSASGGTAGGSSKSQSTSSRDPASVWGPQADFLSQLFGSAGGLAGNFGQYEQQAQGVYDQAMQGFNSMMNPGINPQLQAYQGDVQRNLERNMLPAIGGQAQGFGQMGSSRHGVAEGLALSDANQQITDMASNLYNQDRNRQMGAMGMAPGLAQMGMGIPWYAMNQMKGILGDPTVLQGGARSQSTGSSSNWANNWANSSDTGGGTGSQGWDIGIDLGGPPSIPG